jgi:hypothetical protein
MVIPNLVVFITMSKMLARQAIIKEIVVKMKWPGELSHCLKNRVN